MGPTLPTVNVRKLVRVTRVPCNNLEHLIDYQLIRNHPLGQGHPIPNNDQSVSQKVGMELARVNTIVA